MHSWYISYPFPPWQTRLFHNFAFIISLGVNNSELLFPVFHGILFIKSSSSSLQSSILYLLFLTCGDSLTLISSAHSYFYLPLWHLQKTVPYRLGWNSDLLPFWLLAQFSASKNHQTSSLGSFWRAFSPLSQEILGAVKLLTVKPCTLGAVISHRSVFHLIPLVGWLTFARITPLLFPPYYQDASL